MSAKKSKTFFKTLTAILVLLLFFGGYYILHGHPSLLFLFCCVLFLGLCAGHDGGPHGLVVEAIRAEHQPPGAKHLRLEPGPQQLFRRHAMVAEKTTGGKRCGGQDTHPADRLSADPRLQSKINAHRYGQSQQRANKLP